MAKRKKQSKFLRLALVVLAVFVIITAANFFADFFGTANNENITITVESGDTARDISHNLKQNGVIKSETLFNFLSRLGGKSQEFKTGRFILKKGTGYAELFEILSTSPVAEGEVWVTVPEGYELRQIADELEKAGLINRTIFYDEIENGSFEYDFINEIPKRENRLEGYLFPDTYLFSPTDGEHTIINAMLERFNEVFNENYKKRAEALGMSTDEIITLASIIEREAVGDSDRELVSSVFHNRLKSKEMPYLQSCATIQYILKERKSVLSVSDTKIKSPYNTYINEGLPIGPIASPGEKAIYAALYPQKSDYLFFVLDSSGSHRFAKTYEEHLQNQKK